VTAPLLQVKNLTIDYIGDSTDFRAVDDVSFDVARGEVFGLAGESGCGKSTIAFAISRLHKPPALIRSGRILLEDRDVLDLNPAQLRDFRWREVAMVFQSAGRLPGLARSSE
jgi:peptide/nickel transport system ATP-binding protein